MAARTLTGSGLASVSATWDGSTPLVDGDTVTVAAGQNLTFDIDTSAFTGLGNVVVNASASTPGQLTITNGTLKIRTGATLSGTSGTNRGRVVSNSDGVYGNTGALPFANKALILLEGTAAINAQYLEFCQFPQNPTNLFVTTYGTKYTVTASGSTLTGATLTNTTPVMIKSTGAIPAPLVADTQYYVVGTSGNTFQLATVSAGTPITLTSVGSGTIEVYTGVPSGTSAINVFEDVTGDTPWTNATGRNAVILVNAGPQDYDQQRTIISTIASGVITLGAATDSTQRPGAKIVLLSRNVSNQSTGTSSSQGIVNSATSGNFGEIKNTSGSGTTFYGYGLNSCTNCNPVTVSGCTNGLNSCTNCNPISISGCTYGLNTCTNCNPISISGCTYGLNTCTNCNPISISGCTNGLNSCTNCNPVTVSGCTNGLNTCTNCNPISISGCSNGLNTCTNCNPISISGCSNGLNSCTNCNPGTVSGCTADVNFIRTSEIKQRNKVSRLSVTGRNGIANVSRISYEDDMGVPGASLIYDNFGSITKVLCGSGSPVPAAGPSGASGYCLECSSIQSYCGTLFGLDILRKTRIWLNGGARTITFKTINTFSGGIAASGLRSCVDYVNASGVNSTVCVNSGALSNATDWSQIIAVAITCRTGFVDVTLSLWQYDATVPLLYVWPTPVIT